MCADSVKLSCSSFLARLVKIISQTAEFIAMTVFFKS